MNKGNKLNEPEEVSFEGAKNRYYISKIPAYESQSILLSALSAFQNQDVSQLPQGTVNKLMSYVSCKMGDAGVEESILLDTQAMIDAYCDDVFVLLQLELKMVEKNYGFLFDGRLQKALETVKFTKSTETSNP